MSQRRLAELSGVSNTMIASIERGRGSRGTRPVKPSPETLRLLARGLSMDLVDGAVDEAATSAQYERLMRAAGYLADQTQSAESIRTVERPSDEEAEEILARMARDPEIAALLVVAARKYPDMTPRQRAALAANLRVYEDE